MKYLPAAILLALGATADDLECKSNGVTNKSTCDTWCGGTGGFTSSYTDGTGVKNLQGWMCDCAADSVANSTSDEKCTSTFNFDDDAEDCTSEGVTDKASCDKYCDSGVGAYTAHMKDGDMIGLECICGYLTNEYEKHCVVGAVGTNGASGARLAAGSVLAGLVYAIASL